MLEEINRVAREVKAEEDELDRVRRQQLQDESDRSSCPSDRAAAVA